MYTCIHLFIIIRTIRIDVLRITEIVLLNADITRSAQMNVLYLEFVISTLSSTMELSVITNIIPLFIQSICRPIFICDFKC